MDKCKREMTFEEEAAFYETEARAEFSKEIGNGDSSGINNILRRGMRIIRKAKTEIAELKETAAYLRERAQIAEDFVCMHCAECDYTIDDGICTAVKRCCSWFPECGKFILRPPKGAEITTSCEDENTEYMTFSDGLRLIFRNKEYCGWYVCNEVAEQKWIPVTERLPEVGGSYLVVVKYKYDFEDAYSYDTDVATYRFDGGYIDGCWDTYNDWDEGQQYIHVTHWMPLPEPPKEVDDG